MGESNKLEIWKDVIGYEGCFLVSNFGRIKNNQRVSGNQYFGKIRIGKKDTSGYYSIRLCRSYQVRILRVHGIVAKAFLGDRPKGYVVNHKDGNKLNNRISNLEYVTPSQNCLHAVGLNNWVDNRGSKQGSSKLKEEQVIQMRNLYKDGAKQDWLAKRFGIKQPTVSEIIHKKTWAHV